MSAESEVIKLLLELKDPNRERSAEDITAEANEIVKNASPKERGTAASYLESFAMHILAEES